MESLATPLRALAEEAAWFARDHEVRLLHVVTAVDLRDAVLKILMGQEFHADNRSPFVSLEDGFTLASTGWTERAARLREQHEARIATMAKANTPLPPLPPAPAAGDALTSFAMQARQIAGAVGPPLKGLVIVLAPTRVEDAVAWSAAVTGLVTAKGLGDVRFIVVDLDKPTVADLVKSLGRGAMVVTAIPDEAEVDRDVAGMLDRAAAATLGAPGFAQIGAAWPRAVMPPPRPGQTMVPDGEIKAAMIAAGISPAISPGEGQKLRLLILRAAQALKAGRGTDAVFLQREARDYCDQIGLPKEAITMELVLGAYLVQLGHRPLAIQTYEKAGQRAEEMGMLKEAAQAHLAAGALHGVDKRPDQASLAYARAGALARRAGVPILAIECYRLSGHYCADMPVKVKAWRLALEVASELEANDVKASSAAETARALAVVLRKAGLLPQAAEMDRQSVAFESGELRPIPSPPAPREVARGGG
jgi:tetratricopeptide (TPR) repeat protein